MLNFIIVFFNLYFLITFYALSDMNIIKSGIILESKPYSTNEATLVVSKSKKIYICSVSNNLTKCILSNNKNKIN